MSIIRLENMEFFAYHGHYPEEQVMGNRFLVDVAIETDTTLAENTDQLKDTLDYQKVYRLIRHEMSIRSNLIEHLARRIVNRIRQELGPAVGRVSLTLSKIQPSMDTGNAAGKVSITLTSP